MIQERTENSTSLWGQKQSHSKIYFGGTDGPAFLDGFDEILPRSQVAFLKYSDRYISLAESRCGSSL